VRFFAIINAIIPEAKFDECVPKEKREKQKEIKRNTALND